MAAFIKTKLKSARDLIGKKDFQGAYDAASQVLSYDARNYNAQVFLALSCLELGQLDQSEKAYRAAIESGPEQALAWQGLARLYERTEQWSKYGETLRELMNLFKKANDATKCAEFLQKYIDLQRRHGGRKEQIAALGLVLESSPLYTVLSTLPEPEPTAPTSTTTFAVQQAVYNNLPILEDLVDLNETEEVDFLKREVEKRRTRLGAPPLERLKLEVGLEVWEVSPLPGLYDEILNHPRTPDELRRSTEAKLLRYKHQQLQALSSQDTRKTVLLKEVEDMVNGVVLLGIPDELAWSIFIDSRNLYNLREYDIRMIRKLFDVLPSSSLSSLWKAWFTCQGIPLEEPVEKDEPPPQPNSDALDDVLEILSVLPESIACHRMLSDFYSSSLDFENTIKVSESGLELVSRFQIDYGFSLHLVARSLNVNLSTALVHLFPPKHHRRALGIIQNILTEDRENVKALLAGGYVHQYAGRWQEAAEHFQLVTTSVPLDSPLGLEATEELGWSTVQRGALDEGANLLRSVLGRLETKDGMDHEKSRCWWRLGKTIWKEDDAEAQAESYKLWITALKRSTTFAPAFTSLGSYYSDYATPRDTIRASKCFQKAFELDAREAEAARRLAEGFADEREWDLVEIVARRTIEGEGGLEGGDSGIYKATTRFLPTNAWAWKAVGVVELNKRNYPAAIQSFQIALRADTTDPLSWLRLGEAYAKSGRHAAALKALGRSKELNHHDWMCDFQTGQVHRQLEDHQLAVDAFLEILSQHEEDVVKVALAETRLEMAQAYRSSGFIDRAKDSWAMALSAGLELTEKVGARGVAWKVVSDSLANLAGVLHGPLDGENSLTDALLRTGTLLQQEWEGADDSLSSLEGLSTLLSRLKGEGPAPILEGGVVAGRLSIAACSYRIHLAGTVDTSLSSALFDLAASLFNYSVRITVIPEGAELHQTAAGLLKRGLRLSPGDEVYWNALGTVSFNTNPKLAQHAYIKALEIEPKNPLLWANLGLLYIHHQDYELARQAFLKAQTLDPDFALAWVGQAFTYKGLDPSFNTISLLEHAVGLSAEVPPVDLEFARQTMSQFIHSFDQKSNTPTTDSLLAPFFSLERYIHQLPRDSSALHLAALLSERLGILEGAASFARRCTEVLEHAYEQREDLSTARKFAIASATLGRILVANGEHSDAILAFEGVLGLVSGEEVTDGEDEKERKTVIVLRAQALFGSGLAQFMTGNLEAALSSFETALEEIPLSMPDIKGQITVLLAQTLWGLGSEESRETAKSLLLDCISNDAENVSAIVTLAALGTLLGDNELVEAALSDVLSLPSSKREELDPAGLIDDLLIRHHLLQRRSAEALQVAQQAVDSQPQNEYFKRRLARLLLQLEKKEEATTLLETQANDDPERRHERFRLLAVAQIAQENPTSNPEELATLAVMCAPWEAANWTSLGYIRRS